MKNKKLIVGTHTSIAGGFDKAIERAFKAKGNCLQIFTKSNRQWLAKTITKKDIEAFHQAQIKYNIYDVTAHAAYLINLGSKNDAVVEKSIKALALELQRCEQLRIPYLVLHPGSQRFEDIHASLDFIAQNINIALESSNTDNVILLLETMAGQGNTVGHTFEHLGIILKKITSKKRLGICFDTCHAFAAGYEFHTETTYKAMWTNFDNAIGLSKLKVFHINDSKKESGSKVDRHEDITKGKIPQEAFKLLLKDERFTNIPKILETPTGDDELKNNMKNIATIKQLATE